MQRDLTQVIENIKTKNFDSFGERQIESSIVSPLLDSLGWDITKEDEVSFQSNIGKGRSDIQLKIEGWCKVLIESKKGKADINNFEYERQMMSYAGGVNNREPCDIAILTNGKDWSFYLPGFGGGYDQKRFYSLDIFTQNSKYVTYVFSELLFKDNIAKGCSYDKALSMNNDRLRTEIKKRIPTKNISEKHIIKGYSQDYLSVDSDFTKRPIYSFYFNGSIYKAQTWKDLLVGILDTIYSSHKENFHRVLGVTGTRNRIYFSQDKNDVNNPLEIKDTGIYVDTKLSANNIVRLCSDIIYEFGYSDSDLKIKIMSEKNLFCPNCKKEILIRDANYCKYCGYKLEKYKDVI